MRLIRKFICKLPFYNWLQNQRLCKYHLKRLNIQNKIAIDYIYKHNSSSAVNLDTRPKFPGIISLTSYGKRLGQVHHVIASLANQTYSPEKIILWIAKDDIQAVRLNKYLNDFEEANLEVRLCDDIKSYKKLLPSLKLFPNRTIITVDDDVIYQNDLIENLYKASLESPNTVIAGRAHQILFDDKSNVLPYINWQFDVTSIIPSNDLVAIGIGGVLYPPNSFHKDVTKIDAIMAIAPTCDDLWFKVMSIKHGVKVRTIAEPLPYNHYLHLPEVEPSLWQSNYWNNDLQLSAILNNYKEVCYLLKEQ